MDQTTRDALGDLLMLAGSAQAIAEGLIADDSADLTRSERRELEQLTAEHLDAATAGLARLRHYGSQRAPRSRRAAAAATAAGGGAG